ncbi:MAG: hypothetical protein HRU22_13100, partial [Gammaproteobacteria bacterium]|nr:hypothetical protein [Gammaproteobacteria bacterium]
MKYHAINNKLFTIKPTTLAVATIMCALTTPAMAQQEVTKLQAVTSYGQQDAS